METSEFCVIDTVVDFLTDGKIRSLLRRLLTGEQETELDGTNEWKELVELGLAEITNGQVSLTESGLQVAMTIEALQIIGEFQ